jgi:hypothetical protein
LRRFPRSFYSPDAQWDGNGAIHIRQLAAKLSELARVEIKESLSEGWKVCKPAHAQHKRRKETDMGVAKRWRRTGILATVLLAPLLAAGCAEHATVRVYDPYYSDYHAWNSAELGYYRQWRVETHRPYREFRTLPPPEQREYWAWRHHPPSPR